MRGRSAIPHRLRGHGQTGHKRSPWIRPMESSGKHRFLVRLALRSHCLFLPYCPGFVKATRLPDGLAADRVGVAFFRNQLPLPEPVAFSRVRRCCKRPMSSPGASVWFFGWTTHRNPALEWSNWSRENGTSLAALNSPENSVVAELPAHRFCYRPCFRIPLRRCSCVTPSWYEA